MNERTLSDFSNARLSSWPLIPDEVRPLETVYGVSGERKISVRALGGRRARALRPGLSVSLTQRDWLLPLVLFVLAGALFGLSGPGAEAPLTASASAAVGP